MNFAARTTFKKLLGKGRAWLTPKGFTENLLNLFAYPFEVIKDVLIKLKLTHFPTTNLDENNIKNGEELFNLTPAANDTMEERAATVESQWSAFGGCQTFQQIEMILRKRGLPVRIQENPNGIHDLSSADIMIGNGILTYDDQAKDPVTLTNYKHCFILYSDYYLTQKEIELLKNILIRIKPAHTVAVVSGKYASNVFKVNALDINAERYFVFSRN